MYLKRGITDFVQLQKPELKMYLSAFTTGTTYN